MRTRLLSSRVGQSAVHDKPDRLFVFHRYVSGTHGLSSNSSPGRNPPLCGKRWRITVVRCRRQQVLVIKLDNAFLHYCGTSTNVFAFERDVPKVRRKRHGRHIAPSYGCPLNEQPRSLHFTERPLRNSEPIFSWLPTGLSLKRLISAYRQPLHRECSSSKIEAINCYLPPLLRTEQWP